ncbi:MAG: UbiD family decarboxylase [Geobacter sp.]|nr:UbiD family decarboxylase [Geobacter sp.]
MGYPDLQSFLTGLEESGELHRVPVEVDPVLEIAAVTDQVCKSPGGGKALLFQQVKGSAVPVATNLFGSESRMARALGIADLHTLSQRVTTLFGGAPGPDSAINQARLGLASYAPLLVTEAPCQEIVEDMPSLATLPLIQCWPHDGEPDSGGRALTLPIVFSRDPETGAGNCGIYRVQLFDGETAGIHWQSSSGGAEHWRKYRDRNEPMPVAIALGGAPALTVAAAAPLPDELDEVSFAGFLYKGSLELVRCRTSDLLVPAQAELVIEGIVEPGETRQGGAFGNHTGFYVPVGNVPVMRVRCITRRSSPVCPATVIGRPPMEDCFLARSVAWLMLPFLQVRHPEIRDLHMPVEGIFHGCAIVSMEKRHPDQGAALIRSLWEKGFLRHSRLIVVLDADADIHDLSYVAWRVTNLADWHRDLVIGGETSSPPFTRGKGGMLGIDATRKLPGEAGHRVDVREMEKDAATSNKVVSRWEEYGF